MKVKTNVIEYIKLTPCRPSLEREEGIKKGVSH